MQSKKVLWMESVVLMVTFLMLGTGLSQTKMREMISFSGKVRNIAWDFEYVTLNDLDFRVTPNTKIVDVKGNTLKVTDLKPGLYVVIEVFHEHKDFVAKRITIKPLKGV